MKKALVRLGATAGVVVVVLWMLGKDGRSRLRAAGGRRARYVRGRWQGVRYRLAGGQPDPWADDDVLADRVRSQLGPLEKQLDVPHVHVLVHDGVAMLHGEVPSWQAADRIVSSVLRMSGIEAVESYLHIGLGPGDTRPSEGHLHPGESHALHALAEAAVRGGAPRDQAFTSVRAVLSAFADRIPTPERDHVLAHLPADVRPLATPPRRAGKPPRVRTVPQLVADVTVQAPGRRTPAPGHETLITESVLAALRGLVPEEAEDIAAVLPADLRAFWNAAVPA
jgi:uncharacterized protein (DUF2267 family)